MPTPGYVFSLSSTTSAPHPRTTAACRGGTIVVPAHRIPRPQTHFETWHAVEIRLTPVLPRINVGVKARTTQAARERDVIPLVRLNGFPHEYRGNLSAAVALSGHGDVDGVRISETECPAVTRVKSAATFVEDSAPDFVSSPIGGSVSWIPASASTAGRRKTDNRPRVSQAQSTDQGNHHPPQALSVRQQGLRR